MGGEKSSPPTDVNDQSLSTSAPSAAPKAELSGEVRQHSLTGRLGFFKRLEG